jgi:hypothetical protein
MERNLVLQILAVIFCLLVHKIPIRVAMNARLLPSFSLCVVFPLCAVDKATLFTVCSCLMPISCQVRS